jgi:hypothetical protein
MTNKIPSFFKKEKEKEKENEGGGEVSPSLQPAARSSATPSAGRCPATPRKRMKNEE